MPDSMFDKLGELISEGFESGNFFAQNEKSAESSASGPSPNAGTASKSDSKPAQKQQEKDSHSAQKSTESSFKQDSVHKSIHPDNKNQDCIVFSNSKLIKYAHPDIQKALSFVGVNLSNTTEITFEQAKKLFHKKLMRFHPDKNAKNETMDKITREQTARILDAWKLIEDWFKSQDLS
ncbi:MAG: J domain-containing protein [Treponema sp.]|nr:J domain-containing protein [Treponema sp.]